MPGVPSKTAGSIIVKLAVLTMAWSTSATARFRSALKAVGALAKNQRLKACTDSAMSAFQRSGLFILAGTADVLWVEKKRETRAQAQHPRQPKTATYENPPLGLL